MENLLPLLENTILDLPIGLAILSLPDFEFLRINKFLADINGRSIADHLGKRLIEIIPPAAETIVPRLKEVVASGKTAAEFKFSMPMANRLGGERWFVDVFFPIKNADGKVIAVGAMVRDITEEIKLGKVAKDILSRIEGINS